MRAHTITTKARVGGRGRMKRRIVPGGMLALSLAAALLGATASPASAERVIGKWNCPPLPPAPSLPVNDPQIQSCFRPLGSFDFGYYRPGTTSPAQHFALGVGDNDSFNPRIGVSGDYAQTNNCPPTLSAPAGRVQGCIIDVTLTPTGKGPRRGTLSTGPGGPTVALTGGGEDAKGPPDLQVSAKKKQHPQADGPTCDSDLCEVIVKVSCEYEACTASAKGKLTKVKKDKLKPVHSEVVAPGKKATLGLELTKSQRKQARKALAEGKNVQAKITVKATDADGNSDTAKRTIRIVK
jgi:hypothetical protein